jgi:hypothetical protein
VCRELDLAPPTLTPPDSLAEDHPAAIFAPYFDVSTRFDDRRARRLLDEPGPPGPLSYLPQLLEFALASRWGKSAITREAAQLMAAAR